MRSLSEVCRLALAGVKIWADDQGGLFFKTPWPIHEAAADLRPAFHTLKVNKAAVTSFLRDLAAAGPVVAVDLETSALDPAKGEIRLVSWCGGKNSGTHSSPEPLRPLLADPKILKVFHNAAFDVFWLETKGFVVRNYADSMLLAQVLSNNEGQHSLAALAKAKLNIELDKSLQKADAWTGLITDLHKEYSRKDAVTTWWLWQALCDEARQAGKGICAAARRERRALPAIIRLQRDGMPFDAESWKQALQSYIEQRDRLAGEIKRELMTAINLASPAQLKACVNNRGIPLKNTNDETLAMFEADFPLLARIRQWRELHKLTTGYGEELLKKHVAADGRIYGNWRLIGATTGRMSCGNPNLQQVPHVLRPYFKAPEGRKLVIADYSQIELRVAAEIANCKPMIEAFEKGDDLHRKTAALILGKPADQVTKEERQIAKAANFGLIYGMTSQGLQARAKTAYGLDMTDEQANLFREGFFRLYPQMRIWQNKQKRSKEISTLGGRRWTNLPEPPNYGWRNRLNYPVQGTAAEGLKESLALIMQDLPGDWRLCAVVHDEIVLEVMEGEAEQAAEWLRQKMIEGVRRLIKRVPVEVDVVVSQTWQK